MVAGIRALSTQLNHAISSERSRLSGTAIELVTALLAGLGHSFAPLITLFLPTLIGLCARTNKVFTKRAKTCVLAVIQGTQSQSPLPILVRSLAHKSPAVRLVAAEGILAYLNRPAVDVTRVRLLEEAIKLTSRDASAEVRKTGTKIFEAYKAILPERIERSVPNVSANDDTSHVYHSAFPRSVQLLKARRLLRR
ncbi:hypothetical protein M405DRAFT_925434 [Rhizopogon salebrosus TDB-379]|nr:hypothetical protein M405DRAFT_925434 [Rhizopogon salebrosus TDB-379]